MARAFVDDNLLEWEAYVSGGKPGGPRGARIYFVCLSAVLERPRSTPHASQDPAAAERALREMSEADLLELFRASQPLS